MILASRLKGAHVPLRIEQIDSLSFPASTTASKSVTVPAWARSCFVVAAHGWQFGQSTQRIDTTDIAGTSGVNVLEQIGTGSPYPEYGSHLVMYKINDVPTGSRTWTMTRTVNASIKGHGVLYAANRNMSASAPSSTDYTSANGTITCTVDEYKNGVVFGVGGLGSDGGTNYDTEQYLASIGHGVMGAFSLTTAAASAVDYTMATGSTNGNYHLCGSFARGDFT